MDQERVIMDDNNKPSVGLQQCQGTTGVFTVQFCCLVIAQLFSLLGSAILRFALPLHLLNVSHSVVLYASVSAWAWLPYILITPIGGIISDRVRKSVLMATLDTVLALSCCLYFALHGRVDVISSTLTLLMVLYAVQSMYQPAVQAAIPAMIASEQVPRATALVSQISTVTSIVGPALGGMILGFTTIGMLAGISCMGFAVSAVLIGFFVRIPKSRMMGSGSAMHIVAQDAHDALRFLGTRPLIWETIVVAMFINLLTSAFIMVGSTFIITQMWLLSNQTLGISEAVVSLGGLLGGVLVYRMPRGVAFRHEPRIIAITSIGLVFVVLSLGLPLPGAARLALFVFGLSWVMAGASVFTILAVSYIQTHTPVEHIGKVIALTMSAATCALPLGQFFYGYALNGLSPFALSLMVTAGMFVLDMVLAWIFRRHVNELGG
jgi:MFS family permease